MWSIRYYKNNIVYYDSFWDHIGDGILLSIAECMACDNKFLARHLKVGNAFKTVMFCGYKCFELVDIIISLLGQIQYWNYFCLFIKRPVIMNRCKRVDSILNSRAKRDFYDKLKQT